MTSGNEDHRSFSEKLKHPFPELRDQLKGDVIPHIVGHSEVNLCSHRRNPSL